MLEVVAFAVAGMLLGVFTGLTPGIHVNTVVILVVSFMPALLEHFSAYDLVALIISMSVVHSFVDFIPSILIGAPQEDSVLSVLPGHRMLMHGRGYEAIRLTVVGGLGAIILCVALLPVGIKVIPLLYSGTRSVIPYLLILVLVYMIYSEKTLRRRAAAVLVIAYSGALGMLILNHSVLPQKYALFPVLTGLFGISTLLMSLKTQARMPKQETFYEKGYRGSGVLIGSLGGMVAGLLPGIGSSQSALLVQNVFRNRDERTFLTALGGVNTSDAIYALFALYLIGNPRSGASVGVEYIMPDFTFNDFLFMISIVMLSAAFAAFITLRLAEFFVKKAQGIDYSRFSKYTIAFLLTLVLILTGWKGALAAVTSTAIGLVTPIAGIKRTHCMAVLVVPIILYFL